MPEARTQGKRRDRDFLRDPFIRWIKLRTQEGAAVADYPFSIAAVRQLGVMELHPKVTFFVGENGSGKSTLLEAMAIAAGFNPEGGTKNFRFTTRASHSSLHEVLTLVRGARRPRTGYFLRAESFFNAATYIEGLDSEAGGGPSITGSYGGRSLHEQSHGESFFALFMHRFGPEGLYILDEPEAALSPMRQLAFLRRMHELTRDQASQFIVATHSPFLMAYPEATIYLLSDSGIRSVAYEETEHYQLARGFFGHRDKLLKELLAD
jgi:predicted ATPase